jgi:iron complex outermembrane receptor protein
MRKIRKGLLSFLAIRTGVIVLSLFVVTAWASGSTLLKKQHTEVRYNIEVPASGAIDAFNILAEQTNTEFLFSYDLAETRTTQSVSGKYSLVEALNLMLQDSGLSCGLSEKGAIRIFLSEGSMINNQEKNVNTKKTILSAILAALFSSSSTAQVGAVTNENEKNEAETTEVITVQGIRGSLIKSLAEKRLANRAEDIISAVDVSKFPDQNIAESLQRVPGVQLQRDNGEGRFVSIRGLGPEFNVVTMNGRLLASDSAGREFSFDTLPSELIRSAAVIKSPSADLLEGSIGGTVDVRTARPFDLPAFLLTGSLAGSVETQRGDVGPRASGLMSWTNDNKTFGVLVTGNYSERDFQLDDQYIGGYFKASDHGYTDEGWPNVLGCAAPGPCTGNATLNDAWVPQAVGFNRVDDTRTRETFTVTAQARPTDNVEVTFDALYSTYTTTYDQYGFAVFTRDFGIGGAVVDNLGLNIDGNNDGDLSDPEDEVGARVTSFSKADGTSDIIRAAFPRDTETFMTGLNIVADLSDKLIGEFDVSYSKAGNKGVNKNYFYVTGAPLITWWDGGDGTSLGVSYDEGTGQVPSFSVSDATMDPAYQRSHYIQRDGQDTEDKVLDVALDFNLQLDGDFLSSVDFGSRYTNREKTSVGSFSADNYCWAVCGRSVWGNGFDYDETGVFTGTATDILSTISGDFPRTIPIMDPDAYINALDAVVPGLAAGLQAVPVASRGGTITEDVVALYGKLNFQTEIVNLPVSGNLGLRYVSTDQTANGSGGGNLVAIRPSLNSNDSEFIFDNEGSSSFSNDYNEVLPSLNIKASLRDDLVLRFDASKVITRPTLSTLIPSITAQNQGYQLESITRGNPELDPFEATQFGASLEWYFSDSGALFASVFSKSMKNRVFNAQVFRRYPSDTGANPAVYLSGGSEGQPIEVLVSQPQNTGDEEIDGLEIGFQQSFDNGFGVQLNYTYLDSSAKYDEGLVSRVFGEDSEGAADFLRNPPAQGQGLSENSYNVSAFYENDSLSARIAYNWRAEYLLSPIQGANGWPLYEKARGQLDANVSYNFNENITVFFDATNILEEEFVRFWDNGDTVAFDPFAATVNYYGRTFTLGVRSRF